jgi:CheY-like chemotaxis protein
VGSILLVETDPNTHDRFGTALRAAGHDVIAASTALEALARVGEGGIDVIVIDTPDPRAGTVELARDINALPDAPPLVLMSGSPYAPEISARIGAAAFVPKPCDPAELVAVVEPHAGAVRPVRIIEDFGEDEEPTGPARHFG